MEKKDPEGKRKGPRERAGMKKKKPILKGKKRARRKVK